MRINKRIPTLALAVMLAVATTGGAATSFASNDDLSEVSNRIDSVAQLEGTDKFFQIEENLVAKEETQQVSIESTHSETTCLIEPNSTEAPSFSFSLPTYSSPTLVDDTKTILKANNDNSSTAAIESLEGAVRTSFVLNGPDSPETFPLMFSIPQNEKLQFSEDLEGKTDGSIEAVDENGDAIFAIDKPWAIDANGNKVPTHYEIQGNLVLQVIEHKNSNEVAYPIVADPSVKFSGWFKSGSWGRTKAKSGTGAWKGTREIDFLHLVPTDSFKVSCVTSLANGETANSFRSASWSLVKNKFKSSKKWKNEKSLKTQYYCHANLLAAKGIKYGKWDINIEPARPNVSLSVCAKHGCNP